MTVPKEVEERVAGAPLNAFLATSVDDRPHVTPVWYVYDDEHLLVLTGGGSRKARNVRENPRVAVAIEDSHGPDVSWRVVFRGTATLHDDAERMSDVEARMDRTYRGSEAATDGGEAEAPATVLVDVAVGSANLETY